MNILLVVLHADASRGGAEGYTVTLFHRLLAEGYDGRVAAATFEASIPRDRRVPIDFRGVTRTGRYARFLKSLDRHLDGNPDEIVHAMLPVRRCHVYQPQAGLEVAEWKTLPLAKRIGNARRRAFVATERRLLSGDAPPMTICLSEQTRQQAVEIFERPDRFVTVYHAVDETLFLPVPARDAASPPVCVFVGQDFARKGLNIAIDAIAKHPTARLRVVGGDDAGRYVAQAQAHGLAVGFGSDTGVDNEHATRSERVQFIGATRDVATQLRDADAFVFPTRREPFGMVVVEAMLCGVPPVVSRTAGAAEIVRDGVDGRIVDGEDPAAWAAAIDDVLTNRAAMSAACLARRDELSYSHHLRTLLALYERARR